MVQLIFEGADPGNWLSNVLKKKLEEEENESFETELEIPKTLDGKEYTVNNLKADQQEVLSYVLSKLQNWTCLKETFSPLRMTISGEAGSGKSVFIHTLVTIIRNMFQMNDSAIVAGPTGCSAFNAGGKTLHSLFGIRGDETKNFELSSTSYAKLLKKLSHCIALIIDERSMISSYVLACAEDACKKAIFKGKYVHKNISWGGLPILLLVGDDYQLPPITTGAFDIFSSKFPWTSKMILHGQQLFLETGRDVMFLNSVKRTLKSQNRLQRLLKGVRGENGASLCQEDIQLLCNFHLDQTHFKEEFKKEIESDALYLFATREKKQQHNQSALLQLHSKSNPIAKIKSRTTKLNGSHSNTSSHYDNDRTPSCICLCIGCRVELTGKNYNPNWGLFNGSIGTVLDIVFLEGESPNHGNLPAYVLVDFPLYRGPVFHPNHKTWVPVTPVTTFCQRSNNCCKREFFPLKTAFGKTIHTAQGVSIGPVAPGQPPNAIQKVICDPGTRKFEGRSPGLFYTLLSRVTTIGTEGDFTQSAIYFKGDTMNPSRIKDITLKENGTQYEMVIKRDKWVNYLKQHSHLSTFCNNKKADIFSWANETQFDRSHINAIIEQRFNNIDS